MDFDSFLSEGIHKNTINKSTDTRKITGWNPVMRSKNTVKAAYNKLHSMIFQDSTPFMGVYIVIPPTVSKDNTFYILHKEKANDALWKIYNSLGDKKDDWTRDEFNPLLYKLMKNPEVTAASLEVSKNTIAGLGKGYAILSAAVAKEHQGQSLMSEFYKYLIHQGIHLVSDDSQSPGAIKVWENLAREKGIKVSGLTNGNKLIDLTLTDKGFAYMKYVHVDEKDSTEVAHLVAHANVKT